jgi:hypothetical protein
VENVVNEVLQVLERWVGIAGVSKTICSQAFQSASELREAAQSNVGKYDPTMPRPSFRPCSLPQENASGSWIPLPPYA